jgi:ubiquinone/menaquinone biosynthesis C-methylase UbiE
MNSKVAKCVPPQKQGGRCDSLRPGGYELTDRAIAYCSLPPYASILDLGCGTGLTVEHLIKQHGLQAVGMDPLDDLLIAGQQRNPALPIFKGEGESIPFRDQTLDGIIAECSFSLMPELSPVLKECHRVLRDGGWLMVNDLYLRENTPEPLLQPFPSGRDGLRTAETLIETINGQGFQIRLWEDHSGLLKQFVIQTIMQYGSMRDFWGQFISKAENICAWQETILRSKPGYYMLIARKQWS